MLRHVADRRRVVLGAGCLLALGGVVAIALLTGSSSQPPRSVAAEGSDRWPSDSVTDWKSFADQFSLVSVLAERELPPQPGADPRLDEDLVGREVALRIDRTFWRRPQAPATVEEGTTVPVVAFGWSQKDGEKRVPFNVAGGPRLEVGQRYLIPLVRADGLWTPVGQGAILTVRGDTVTSEVGAGQPSPGAQRLKGQTIERAGRVVAGTPPGPVAAKYQDLDPDARYRAVSRESSE